MHCVAFIRKFLILFFGFYLSLTELVHLKVKSLELRFGQIFVKKTKKFNEVWTSTTFSIFGQILDQTQRSNFQVLSQETFLKYFFDVVLTSLEIIFRHKKSREFFNTLCKSKGHSLCKQCAQSSVYENRILLTKPFQTSQSWYQLSVYENKILVQNFL